MKREAFVSLGLWLVYAVSWHYLLKMTGGTCTSLLGVVAILPSLPMSEWFWDGICDIHFGTRWSRAWIWIQRWGFGMIWVVCMGFLVGGVLEPFDLEAYAVPVMWLTFILIPLYGKWRDVKWGEMETTSHKSA